MSRFYFYGLLLIMGLKGQSYERLNMDRGNLVNRKRPQVLSTIGLSNGLRSPKEANNVQIQKKTEITKRGPLSTNNSPSLKASGCVGESGSPCQFPFTWEDVEHTACTMDDPPEGEPWCKVGENATHLHYDNCNMATCELECNGKLGDPCIFPFTWQGVEHSSCTMDDPPNGVPWCKVGENGTTLIYEDCNMETCKAECVGQLGSSCIFPFTWQDNEHHSCTMDDPPNGVPWCKIGQNGTTLIYDDCNMNTCKAECVAVNGEPCIFPFNYQGKTFDKCTHYDANFGKVWCAVVVNTGGDMTSWKDCDTEACKDDISNECLGDNGEPCIFPFNYKGQTFDECTLFDANANKAWCAVAVNEDGDMTSWKNCIMASCTATTTPASTSAVTSTTESSETTTSVTSSTEASTLFPHQCPLDKMKAVKPQIMKENKNIKNWESCAEMCRKNNGCVAWTYRPKNKKPKKTAFCSIFSKYKSFSSNRYTISGTADCPKQSTTLTSTLTSTSTTPKPTSNLTTTAPPKQFKVIKELILYLSNRKETVYKCYITLNVDIQYGMNFEVGDVICHEDDGTNVAINSEIGLYRFQMEVEENVKISCQFAGVYQNSTNPISKNCIQESIKCEPYCKAVGGSELDKPCIFPFVWKERIYGQCTDIDHPDGVDAIDLYCATKVDEITNEMIRWGKCSRTCGYCYGSEVSQDTRLWESNDREYRNICKKKNICSMIPGNKFYRNFPILIGYGSRNELVRKTGLAIKVNENEVFSYNCPEKSVYMKCVDIPDPGKPGVPVMSVQTSNSVQFDGNSNTWDIQNPIIDTTTTVKVKGCDEKPCDLFAPLKKHTELNRPFIQRIDQKTNVKEHFLKYALYYKDQNYKNGALFVRQNDVFQLTCNGNFEDQKGKTTISNLNTIFGKCEDTGFALKKNLNDNDALDISLEDLMCNHDQTAIRENAISNKFCNGNDKKEVSLKWNDNEDPQLRTCIDESGDLPRSLWSAFEIFGSSIAYQTSDADGVKYWHSYLFNAETFNLLSYYYSKLYKEYNPHYDKGHFAKSGYFSFNRDRYTTYIYENCSPQLGISNNGLWSSVEKSIEKYAKNTMRNLRLITGALYSSNEFIPYAYYSVISSQESLFNDGVYGAVVGVVQDLDIQDQNDQNPFYDATCTQVLQNLRGLLKKTGEGRLFCFEIESFIKKMQLLKQDQLYNLDHQLDDIIKWSTFKKPLNEVKLLTFLSEDE